MKSIVSENVKFLTSVWNESASYNNFRFFLCFSLVCHVFSFCVRKHAHFTVGSPGVFQFSISFACFQIDSRALSTSENWFRATGHVLPGLAASSHCSSGGDQVCSFFSAFQSPITSQETYSSFPCPAQMKSFAAYFHYKTHAL